MLYIYCDISFSLKKSEHIKTRQICFIMFFLFKYVKTKKVIGITFQIVFKN